MSRNIIVYLIVFLLCCGCKEEPHNESLRVAVTEIECREEGGSYDIVVTGPDTWETDNTTDWIGIERYGHIAHITVSPNSGKAREATFNFIYKSQKVPFTVIQEHSGIFTVNPGEIGSSFKGGKHHIDIGCYSNWEIYEEYDWIHTDIASSDKPERVELTIDESTEIEPREAVVEIRCGARTNSIIIRQEKSPYIRLQTEEIAIDGDGGIVEILFISNVEVEISTEDSWIRLIESDYEINMAVFEILRNSSEARTGYVKISAQNEKEYFRLLTIRQGEKIDHPKISFKEGTHLSVSERNRFRLNPVFEDMKDTTLIWSTEFPDIAEVDAEGNVSILSGGECAITAQNAFHGISCSIKLDIKLKAESMQVMLGTQNMTESPTAVRFPGEIMEVKVNMHPEDSYCEDVVCISSDPSVVSVSGMTLKCLSPGKAVISVESLYQNLRESFSIIVLSE